MKQLICDNCKEIIKDTSYVKVKISLRDVETNDKLICNYGNEYLFPKKKHYCKTCYKYIFEDCN